MIGYITFRLAQRELACRLNDVREVVRLHELQVLPGLNAPVSGLLELRGMPLPVIDLRGIGAAAAKASSRSTAKSGAKAGAKSSAAKSAATKPGKGRARKVATRGDVLVWTAETDPVGVAVDEVTGVLDDNELESSGEEPAAGLPQYVVEIMRRPGQSSPVLLVDLRRLIRVAAA